ncbi:m7GpppX diphosphatase [Sabethes cyaneus]|uniref:m7GpppX diphosphatase n=1 Tax=Sabethes cyaneus TaxID=53552 RepID=UPI00237E606D|nr:m7GpppX diphosphatase [Sabethes cyaneus]
MLEGVDPLKTASVDNISNNQNYDESQRRQGQPASATLSNRASDSSSVSIVVEDGVSRKTDSSYQLANFEPVRILNNNSTHKSVSLLGHFVNLSRENYAIVVLEKTAFTEPQLRNHERHQTCAVVTIANPKDVATNLSQASESVQSSATGAATVERSFFSTTSQLRTEFVNDIYGNFLCVADPEVNQIKVTIIYPATEKHIIKFSTQKKYLLEETARDYQTVTLPHIQREQLSLEWLYNILEHRKEQDRIIFEDPSEELGFILLPDIKWDGKTLEQLYLLALVRQRSIKSLRDLNDTHLPLLKNIQKRGIDAIKTRYGIGADQLRVYIHYQPSFYHLHVHLTYLKHDPPGIQCEKSHLLTSVIGNLELLPDYYQKATLSCVLSETDKLYKKFEAARSELIEPEPKRAKLE